MPDRARESHGLSGRNRALRSGGRVATLEFVPNEDPVSPPMPAAFAMTMLTSMYGQAGFGSVTAHPIPMSPHTIVMGRA